MHRLLAPVCCLALLLSVSPPARATPPCLQPSITPPVKKVCALMQKYMQLVNEARPLQDRQPGWVKDDLAFLATKLTAPERATVDQVTWAGSAANYRLLNDKVDANLKWINQGHEEQHASDTKMAAQKAQESKDNQTCNPKITEPGIKAGCKTLSQVYGTCTGALERHDTRLSAMTFSWLQARYSMLRVLPKPQNAKRAQILDASKNSARYVGAANQCAKEHQELVASAVSDQKGLTERFARTKVGEGIEHAGDEIGKMSAEEIGNLGCKWMSKVANPWGLIAGQLHPALKACNAAMMEGFYCKATKDIVSAVAHGVEGLKEHPKTCAAVALATANTGTLACGTVAYVTPRLAKVAKCLNALYADQGMFKAIKSVIQAQLNKPKTPAIEKLKAGCELIGGVLFDMAAAAISGGGTLPNSIQGWVTTIAKKAAEEAIPGVKWVTGRGGPPTPTDEKLMGYLDKVQSAANLNMPAACKQ
jgi:hypothetical protein